jgi:hypothetical protein
MLIRASVTTTGNEHEPFVRALSSSSSLSSRATWSESHKVSLTYSSPHTHTHSSSPQHPQSLLITLLTARYHPRHHPTAFGALSLVHRVYAPWSSQSLHSPSIRSHFIRNSVNCTHRKHGRPGQRKRPESGHSSEDDSRRRVEEPAACSPSLQLWRVSQLPLTSLP